MALSLSWTRTQNPAVEVEQRQLFKWMGYDDLTLAPYDELKYSLKRLESTQIAIFQEGSDPRHITPFRLIDSVVVREEPREKGKPMVIHTTLNRVWEQALATSDWQAVDLIGYAKLVREHRMVGLARVIYLFLASWRQPDGGCSIWAQRLPPSHLRASREHTTPSSWQFQAHSPSIWRRYVRCAPRWRSLTGRR